MNPPMPYTMPLPCRHRARPVSKPEIQDKSLRTEKSEHQGGHQSEQARLIRRSTVIPSDVAVPPTRQADGTADHSHKSIGGSAGGAVSAREDVNEESKQMSMY